MTAAVAALIATLESRGVTLRVSDGRLLARGPVDAETRAALRVHKAEILAALAAPQSQEPTKPTEPPSSPSRPRRPALERTDKTDETPDPPTPGETGTDRDETGTIPSVPNRSVTPPAHPAVSALSPDAALAERIRSDLARLKEIRPGVWMDPSDRFAAAWEPDHPDPRRSDPR